MLGDISRDAKQKFNRSQARHKSLEAISKELEFLQWNMHKMGMLSCTESLHQVTGD